MTNQSSENYSVSTIAMGAGVVSWNLPLGAQQLKHIRMMKIGTNATLDFDCIIWQDLY